MKRLPVTLASLSLTLVGLLPAPAQAATATTVSASVSSSSVTLGTGATVTGTASGRTGRTVRLQVRLDTGWRTLSSTTTSSTRRYRLSAPSTWLGAHRLRVVAPAVGSFATGTSSTRSFTVRPSWTPAGSTTDWTPLSKARPRFNPCTPITWKFNQNGGYSSSLTDVKGAFTRLAQATGLTFSYQGTTRVVPGMSSYDTSTAITVGFVSSLAGATAGKAGGTWTTHDGTAEMIRGVLMLDRSEKLAPGFATSGDPDWGQVMQHELAHALGLGHAAGSNQLMYGTASWRNHRLGAGDLTGLGTVGLQPGCIPNPVRKV